ncbi:MAG: Ku protein [Candidatus Dojkabacteria bacterium]
MRPIWTGGISFGLIYIPVNLYTGSESIELDLDLLSKKDKSPIRYARIDTHTGKEVSWKDVVKGFQFSKGDYVILEEEDFEKVTIHRSKTIDIECFVKEDEIDSKYYEKPYYLEPAEGAEKTYSLFAQSLKKSRKVGIAEFVFKNREHLCALKFDGDILILNQLRYDSEIKPIKELKVPKTTNLKEKELDLAMDLIDNMTEKFTPEDFKDDYITGLKKVIEAKAKNKTFKISKNEAPKATNMDELMESLQKSLETIKVKK